MKSNRYLEKLAALLTREDLLKHYATKLKSHGEALNSPASRAARDVASKGFVAAKSKFDLVSGLGKIK